MSPVRSVTYVSGRSCTPEHYAKSSNRIVDDDLLRSFDGDLKMPDQKPNDYAFVVKVRPA
jgi:hypothetical protein